MKFFKKFPDFLNFFTKFFGHFFQFIFRECKSYSDNPLCDYIDNDGKEGFGQGTDVRPIRANILGNNFVKYFVPNNTLVLDEHLIRHCHGCMATYSCFTRNRFHPIRIPEHEDPVFSKRPVIIFLKVRT